MSKSKVMLLFTIQIKINNLPTNMFEDILKDAYRNNKLIHYKIHIPHDILMYLSIYSS